MSELTSRREAADAQASRLLAEDPVAEVMKLYLEAAVDEVRTAV